LLDCYLLDLLHSLWDVYTMIISQHLRHFNNSQLSSTILLKVGINIQCFSLVNGWSVELPHPISGKIFLKIELNYSIFHFLPILKPFKTYLHLLLLTKTKVLFYILHLIFRRLLNLQSSLKWLHVENTSF
jgi:hypothetical protein